MQLQIAPSLLSADFLHLEDSVKAVDQPSDFLHLDVMDGTLVPNISYGFPIIEAISKITQTPMDAHLMVVHPERWFKRLAELGTSMVSFHLEAVKRDFEDVAGTVSSFIDEIHSLGMKAGIAINPDMPVEELYPYLGKADFFLVMSVFAGFGGQKFIPESIDRIKSLKSEIERAGSKALIEVDGGVGTANSALLGEAGATILVAGSSVFKSACPSETINALKK